MFKWLTVVMMPMFEKRAAEILSAEQLDDILDIVAQHPEIGELIAGTGGVRKWRYANKPGKGKSGGARMIHYYINEDSPVIMVTAFDKGDQANLTDRQKNEMKKLTAILKEEYGK